MSAGWDCHAHLFGPYERYPLAADRSYTPPEAPAAHYLALLDATWPGARRSRAPERLWRRFLAAVRCAAQHPNLRGVVVLRADTSQTLTSLHAKGVRAARFSRRSGAGANFAGSASFDDLLALAPALADAGLHAELWTDCKALPDIADRLRELPLPVVIDHMGGFDAAAGVDDAGFRCLLELLATGRIWVKLCAYRNLLQAPDFELGKPFHDAMLRANPERLLWGSDWPHLRVTPTPDAAQLLDKFKRWTADDAMVSRILVTNPGTLYL